MRKSVLKHSDIEVSGLALGTWVFGGGAVWGDADRASAVRTVHHALDSGVNLIDTADRYGSGLSEEIVGEALRDRRHRAVLATKVYTHNLHHDDLIASCEASLKRLQTDYIDYFQIHWPDPNTSVEETFGAFEELKQAGKIRAYGVCNAGASCIAGMKQYDVAMNQLPYSLIWRIAEKKIIPASDAAGVPICAYSPLAQGLLTGKFRKLEDVPVGRRETRFYDYKWTPCRHKDPGFEKEIFAFLDKFFALCEENGIQPTEAAMSFLKRRENVQCILVGARSVDQLDRNIAAYEKDVPAGLMDQIETESDALKEIMGENADMWIGDGGRFY